MSVTTVLSIRVIVPRLLIAAPANSNPVVLSDDAVNWIGPSNSAMTALACCCPLVTIVACPLKLDG